MSSARRYLAIALSFTLALTTLSIVGPRAVQAVTAAMVQVVNTNAHPIPASTDGRNVIRLDCLIPGNTGNSCGLRLAGQTNPYIVPAGKRLVIDAASVLVHTPTGYPATASSFDGEIDLAFPLIYQNTTSSIDNYASAPPIRDYVEAGKSFQMTVEGTSLSPPSLYGSATGHLVDCTNGGGC